MAYTAVLFDFDNTLFDSATSQARAFEATMHEAGIVDIESHLETYNRINDEMWAAVEAGTITLNDLRVTRWERLVAAHGLDADPAALSQRYLAGLGEEGDLYPTSISVLNELVEHVPLALVTNGFGPVQRMRIARLGLERYFEAIIISGEVGVSKPAVKIMELTFRQLGERAGTDALIVGDSLTSDIQGGINYGIDTCWYNPGALSSNGQRITHEIRSLGEVIPIVRVHGDDAS